MSYGALNAGASRAANVFLSLGLKPDDRVCYLGKNTPVYYQLLLAAVKAGGVICPINWRLAVPEIAYILNDARTRFLFVSGEFSNLVDELEKLAPEITHVFCVEENDHGLPTVDT